MFHIFKPIESSRLPLQRWGDESESFALFPDYTARFRVADRTNISYISTLSNGTFEAVFSALEASGM